METVWQGQARSYTYIHTSAHTNPPHTVCWSDHMPSLWNMCFNSTRVSLSHSPSNHLVSIASLSYHSPASCLALPSCLLLLHPSVSTLPYPCLTLSFSLALTLSVSSHLSAVQEAASVAGGHLAQFSINETARCFPLPSHPHRREEQQKKTKQEQQEMWRSLTGDPFFRRCLSEARDELEPWCTCFRPGMSYSYFSVPQSSIVSHAVG